jgi:hypothetical protein
MDMSDAFLAAELLAEAIHDAWPGTGPSTTPSPTTSTGETFSPPMALSSPLPQPGSRLSQPGSRPSAEPPPSDPRWPHRVSGVRGGAIPIADVYPDHIETAQRHGYAGRLPGTSM